MWRLRVWGGNLGIGRLQHQNQRKKRIKQGKLLSNQKITKDTATKLSDKS